MIAYWRVFVPPCNLLSCQRPEEDSDWCHQNTIASDLFFCFFPLTIYVTQHEILMLCTSLLSRNSFFSTPLPGKRAAGEVCHQGPYITSRAIWTTGLFRRWKRMAKYRVQNLGSDPWESIGKKSREIEFPWYSITIPSTKIISMEETPFQELSWLLSSIQKIPRFSSVRSYFIGVPANDSLPCNREAFIWKAEQLRNN